MQGIAVDAGLQFRRHRADDALAHAGASAIAPPATSEKVWRALKAARAV